MVDETYTVYWRLCADGGCVPRSTARGEWRAALGFLVQGQELSSEAGRLTVAVARQQCERDARCTSFCYNCGPTDCAVGEDQLVTVYFKTFAEPRMQIRHDPNNFWHSHLLEVDAAADSDCERGSAASEQMHLSSYRQGNPFEDT